MKTKELLKLQNTSESTTEQDNKASLNKPEINELQETEVIFIEGTPFSLIRFKKTEEWRISIGNNQVVKNTFKTTMKAKRFIRRKPWMLMLNASLIINSINNGRNS